jgi:coenzyme F420-reducing hydrogenase gamma subunit
MRRAFSLPLVSFAACTTQMRFHGAPASSSGKKTDLFGYAVDTNTAPWIEKIKAVKVYDAAGEIIVDMNLANCPPDLATYNMTLRKIFECETKSTEPGVNESKFCAMMDLMEEMRYRGGIKPNEESWSWVMKECVKSGAFRLGYVIERVMKAECGQCPAELAQANEANAAKAKADGKEHPGHLAKQTGVFESMKAEK